MYDKLFDKQMTFRCSHRQRFKSMGSEEKLREAYREIEAGAKHILEHLNLLMEGLPAATWGAGV